jgi:hypothetical protein
LKNGSLVSVLYIGESSTGIHFILKLTSIVFYVSQ